MLKKLIIYLLVASFILTVPAAVSAEKEYNMNSVNLFDALGIINGQDYYGRMDKELSRGEFAIIAAGLLRGGEQKAKTQVFADVPTSHKAAEAVAVLKNSGLVSGTSDNRFEPDRAITYNEALSVVIKMLGYGEFIGVYGGYPAGCAATVNKFKLFAYSDLTNESTAGNILELLYEAAKEYTMEITSISDGYNQSEVSDDTLLSKYFDVYYTEGVLTSDGIVDIKSTDIPKRDEIVVDGVVYSSAVNYSDYLGREVICFYKEITDSKKAAVFVAPTDRNNVLVISSDQAYAFENMTLKYETEKGKNSKIKLTRQADIVYNYAVVTQFNENILLPENGVLKFIDNDNDGNYDVVLVTSYTSFLINSLSRFDDGVYLYSGAARTTPAVKVVADGENDTLISKNGKAINHTDIKKGMVASVAGIEENGCVVAKEIILSDTKLFGDITGYEDDGVVFRLLIDDEPYPVSSSFVEISRNIGMRTGTNLYLDFMGHITDIDEPDMTALDLALGYIIGVSYDDSKLNDSLKIKVLTEASKMVIYEANETVTIDGEKYKGKKNILAALSDEDGNVKPQLVTYKISEERKISYIDMAEPYTGEISDNYYDRLTVTTPMQNQYYQKEQFSFDGNITMDAATKVFVIPADIEGAEDSDFQVIKHSDVAGSLSYKVEGYSLNNDRITCDAVVMESSSQTMPAASVAMAITRISKTMNSDGDETYAVTLMGMKGEEKYVTTNCTVVENAYPQSTADKNTYKLGVGDIVRITTNKKNEIDNIILIYDYSEKTLRNGMQFAGSYFSLARTADASVYNIMGEYMQITDYDLSTLGEGEYLGYENLENQRLSKFVIVKYDRVRDNLVFEKGKAEDLVSYKNNSQEYSRIVIYTHNAVEKILFVLD